MTENDLLDVSVVIGFKDWGVDRLALAVTSLIESFGSVAGEVIVSDYGSTTCPDLRSVVEGLGGRYVYTRTDGVWSRSRALNAGFSVSKGRVLISTDADMLFSPGSLGVVVQRILADPTEALALQCRDLPEGIGSAYVAEHGMQWQTFAERCTLRPRWGMGGMMAVPRQAFLDVRGFDERMEIYGGEDLDFAQRIRRSGRRVSWIEHPEVRMYHMWHPSSRTQADETTEGRVAVTFNRDVYLNDTSFVRNTTSWRHPAHDSDPVVSVVIVTRNRAEMLSESIHSALAQSVGDLEVIVVDDGSEDDTRAVVEAIKDERLRYFTRPALGVAAARNFAATQTRARYTVIHDDDDLMMPDRVQHHLAALQAGDSGTYGGWIDFDDRDGSVVAMNPGKPFSLEALLFGSKVFAHGTLMVETRLLRQVGYDERFTSGSDYNLAVRLSRLGINLRHTGQVHIARRMHSNQLTEVSSRHQQSAGRWATAAALGVIPLDRHAALRTAARASDVEHTLSDEAVEELLRPFLPDRLVKRDVVVALFGHPPEMVEDRLSDRLEVRDLLHPGRGPVACAVLRSATWKDLADLRAQGAVVRVIASRRNGTPPPASGAPPYREHSRLLADSLVLRPPATTTRLVFDCPALETCSNESVLGHWDVGGHDVQLLALASSEAPDGRAGQPTAPSGASHAAPVVPQLTAAAAPARPAAAGPRGQGKGTQGSPATTRATARAAAGATARASGRGGDRRTAPRGQAKEQLSPGQGPRAVRPQHRARQGPGAPRGIGATARPAPPRSRLRRSLTRMTTPLRLTGLALVLAGASLAASLGVVRSWLPGVALVAFVGWLAVLTVLIGLTASRLKGAMARLEQTDRRGADRLQRRIERESARTRRLVRRNSSDQRRDARKSAARLVRQSRAHWDRALQAGLDSTRSSVVREMTRASTAAVDLVGAHEERSRKAVDSLRSELLEALGAQADGRVDLARHEALRTELLEAIQAQADGRVDLARLEALRTELLSEQQALLNLFTLVQPQARAPRLGGWAASAEVMLHLVDQVLERRPSLVLECGSGASTVWLAMVAETFGLPTKIVALEHDEGFARATREQLVRHGLHHRADVRLAPLTLAAGLEGHTTPWYDLSAVHDLDDIGLLFVDGPPGMTGKAARWPAVPLLQARLAQSCTIVLDDTNRPDERCTAERWEALLTDFTVTELEANHGAVTFTRASGAR